MADAYEARNAREAARDFYNGSPIQPDNTFATAEAKRLAEQKRQEIQNRLSKGQPNPNLAISQDYGGFSFIEILVPLIFSRFGNRSKRTSTTRLSKTTQTNPLLGLLSGSVRVVRLKLRKRQAAGEVCVEARHPEFVEFTGSRE